MEFNIIMIICEDDLQLKSTFFLDIGNLLKTNNNIPIHIIYHSEHFYNSFFIKINRESFTSTKIKKININYRNVKKSIETMYNNFYNPRKKNILYYGGHSNWLFKDSKTCLKTNIFENIHHVELLILDACYTSYSTLLSTLVDKANYVLACSTASPNLGFLSDKFLNVLNATSTGNITKYKRLIDLFIIRNSNTNELYKKFNYRTDASLIDVNEYKNIEFYIKNINKKSKCKIEHQSRYYFYDLLCLIDDDYVKEKIKKCILYSKVNDLAIQHYKNKNIDLGGIITGIK